MSIRVSGFLVVLAKSELRFGRGGLNPNYSGVDRVPTYPPEIEGEAAALDDYVFGGMKSTETNLIPELGIAISLRQRLSVSGRRFEILFCSVVTDITLPTALEDRSWLALGYDVAIISGDYWSAVADFSASEWAKPCLERLNEFGLFSSARDAETYLENYRNHKEADSDMLLEIVHVRVNAHP